MKITIKQLRKIIKEELENTLANSNDDNIDIEWGKGKVEDSKATYLVMPRGRERSTSSRIGKVEDSQVTYPVIIASGDFKVRTWVSYDYDSIDEPTCSMTEEGDFNYIGNEELENNMSEEEFFATQIGRAHV